MRNEYVNDTYDGDIPMRRIIDKQALFTRSLFAATIFSLCSHFALAADGDEAAVKAFPDKYMIRVGAYFVDSSNTQFSINSNRGIGIGTSIDYNKDLGGEQRDTIPRLDIYYRFNDYHRIDFTSFSIDRSGERILTLDLDIGDQTFNVSESVNSKIDYTLYKLAYAYSFYHSSKVELSFTAGLNITTYDLDFRNGAGNKSESGGVTAPLPIFGLKMGYAITPAWSINYLMEAFAIEIEDKFSGSLTNFELSTEYRLFKNFALGAGIATLELDAEVSDDDLRGEVNDRYAGFLAFGTLYF